MSALRPSRWAARVCGLALAASACLPADWGASAILHPWRRPVRCAPSLAFEELAFESAGLTLRGWLFRGQGARRGLIVYLHGIADNRCSAVGVAARYATQGWDVLAYDARGHGASDGSACTYGFHEKRDLSRALDALGAREAVAFGSSLGAAVALQAAAEDPRIRGVIAQSPFADLEAIILERAPLLASNREIREAMRLAEQRGGFRVHEVSPRAAAARIRVPVLLIHGARDRKTRPAHSLRIFEALAGPKRLVILEEAGHDDVLGGGSAWEAIGDWLDALPRREPPV